MTSFSLSTLEGCAPTRRGLWVIRIWPPHFGRVSLANSVRRACDLMGRTAVAAEWLAHRTRRTDR